MGNERRVIHTFWHIAFVAGKNEYMVEIQVARLQHAHYLYATCRLPMEGNACRRDKLCQQPAEDNFVGLKVAACHQVAQSCEKREHTEYRLLE